MHHGICFNYSVSAAAKLGSNNGFLQVKNKRTAGYKPEAGKNKAAKGAHLKESCSCTNILNSRTQISACCALMTTIIWPIMDLKLMVLLHINILNQMCFLLFVDTISLLCNKSAFRCRLNDVQKTRTINNKE